MRRIVLLAAAALTAGGLAITTVSAGSAAFAAGPGRTRVPDVRIRTHQIHVGGHPGQAAVDPRTGTAWVGTGAEIVRIRESTGRVKTITGVQNNATGVAIDPAARKVLVADDQDTGSSVFILSEKTDQITSKIGVGFFPSNPAIDPVTGKAYVPIAFRATVTEFRI